MFLVPFPLLRMGGENAVKRRPGQGIARVVLELRFEQRRDFVMKPHRAATIWVILGAASLLFGGCQQTVRQARVAAPAPTPEPATASMAVQSLPLPPEPRFQGGLVVDARPKIDVLVARVEASFAAGQKEYEAGDLDKARAHFNRALDLIMSSGFQVGFDPRLSRLFDQLGKAMETDE